MFLSLKKYQKCIGLKVQLLLVHFKWIKSTFRNRYKRIFVCDLHNCLCLCLCYLHYLSSTGKSTRLFNFHNCPRCGWLKVGSWKIFEYLSATRNIWIFVGDIGKVWISKAWIDTWHEEEGDVVGSDCKHVNDVHCHPGERRWQRIPASWSI